MCMKRDALIAWIPNAGKHIQDYTPLEVWASRHKQIADFCRLSPGTMDAYTDHLVNIQDALIDKKAKDMTAYDCWSAARSKLCKKDGRPYSGSSLYGRLIVLGHIFDYLSAIGICYNPLVMPPWELMDNACKDIILGTTVEDLRLELEMVLYRTRNDLRSISKGEERKLIRQAMQHLLEDGRYLGLLLYLYLGVRPAEGRGITYGDIKAYTFDSSRHYVDIITSMTRGTERAEHLKTKTSYRRLPVHIELETLMQRRIQHIKEATGVDNIDDYPVICHKNEYDRPCTHGEMEYFTKSIFEKCLSKETLRGVMLGMYDEIDEDSEKLLPSLYILRKNFATKCYAETCLKDDEVRLLMGHKLDTSVIAPYCEQAVYEYGRKMDHRMLEPELRSDWYTVVDHEVCVEQSNVGVHCITIPPEVIAKGLTLHIELVTMTPGDSIMLQHSALPVDSTITYDEVDFMGSNAVDVPLNMDATTWPLQDWLIVDDSDDSD